MAKDTSQSSAPRQTRVAASEVNAAAEAIVHVAAESVRDDSERNCCQLGARVPA
jgi:hypothetical protein